MQLNMLMVQTLFVPALNASMIGIMIPVSMLITLGYSRILYNKERKAMAEK